MKSVRWAASWLCYGIGHGAWWVYQTFMRWSSEIQGENGPGPWEPWEKETPGAGE